MGGGYLRTSAHPPFQFQYRLRFEFREADHPVHALARGAARASNVDEFGTAGLRGNPRPLPWNHQIDSTEIRNSPLVCGQIRFRSGGGTGLSDLTV
jgi:hypothetical protein